MNREPSNLIFEDPFKPEGDQHSILYYFATIFIVLLLIVLMFFILALTKYLFIALFPVGAFVFFVCLSAFVFSKRFRLLKNIKLLRDVDIWKDPNITTVFISPEDNLEIKFKRYQIFDSAFYIAGVGDTRETLEVSINSKSNNKFFCSKVVCSILIKPYQEFVNLLEQNKINTVSILYYKNTDSNLPLGIVLNDKYYLPLNNSLVKGSSRKNFISAYLSSISFFGLIFSLEKIISYLDITFDKFLNVNLLVIACCIYPLFSLVCFIAKTSFRNTIKIRGLNNSYRKEIPQWHPKK